MKPSMDMYSPEWFETFAATVPAAIVEEEIKGLADILPLERYRRVLDVGCGIGRITGPLSSLGYAMTGLDISVAALRSAKLRAPGARYVALDQQHVGCMRWELDAALFMWNSLGFVGRSADVETLAGVKTALRPGGKVVFDMYHPDWLRQNETATAASTTSSSTCTNLTRSALSPRKPGSSLISRWSAGMRARARVATRRDINWCASAPSGMRRPAGTLRTPTKSVVLKSGAGDYASEWSSRRDRWRRVRRVVCGAGAEAGGRASDAGRPA